MKKSRTLMIQGTASAAGKSIIVTALCRIFRQDGYRVAPFKAQNMALNSFVTKEGGEIGRAQAVQAEAAGIEPKVDMNPVLLKPASGTGCQVIVMGRVFKTVSTENYATLGPFLIKKVEEALNRLRAEYDIVVIEGAGSPAEINLKDRDIVNMRTARMAISPVLLVGDIDKGGVFASLVGTLALLDEDERRYVKGIIINKFRGDLALLQDGLDILEKRTGKPVLGVVPYFHDIRIAQEDSVYLDERPDSPASKNLDIAVIRLPHVSNYDDFDPLEDENCQVRYITQRLELGNPHLIILPGTKSTVSDLAYLRHSGLANSILRKAGEGVPVIGICGGYQMLGRKILDPYGVESPEKEIDGLGLLDTVTEFIPEKSTRQVKARVRANRGLLAGAAGRELTGYEIHMGQTDTRDNTSAFRITEAPEGITDNGDGMLNEAGTVMGTYLHGLFHNRDFCRVFLNTLRRRWGLPEDENNVTIDKNDEYDKLARLVRESLDIPAIYQIMAEKILPGK
jgi:adenosylcobyric acid synthase